MPGQPGGLADEEERRVATDPVDDEDVDVPARRREMQTETIAQERRGVDEARTRDLRRDRQTSFLRKFLTPRHIHG